MLRFLAPGLVWEDITEQTMKSAPAVGDYT